jgi:hypothetical protein
MTEQVLAANFLEHRKAHRRSVRSRSGLSGVGVPNGATAPELMAICDWETLAVAQKYIEEANRVKMAARAMPLIIPPPRDGENSTAKMRARSMREWALWQEWRDSNPQPPVLETGNLARR